MRSALCFLLLACTGGQAFVTPVATPIPSPASPSHDPVDNAMAGEGRSPATTTASPERDYEAHVKALRARLPHDGFHVVVEAPFVVTGDGGKAAVERAAERTVRWATRRS